MKTIYFIIPREGEPCFTDRMSDTDIGEINGLVLRLETSHPEGFQGELILEEALFPTKGKIDWVEHPFNQLKRNR